MTRTGVKSAWIPAALAVATLLLASPAMSAVPTTMNFEGTLRATGGGPASDGSYKLTFALYDVAKGGKALWSEGPISVALSGGHFHHALGSNKAIPASVTSGKALFLELQVGADPALPRQQLRAVPFAAAAARLDCSGCVSVKHMKFDGDINMGGYAITATKIVVQDMIGKTVTAQKFVGDGSGLTGIKASGSGVKAGTCPSGKVMVGVDKNGNIQCASTATSLPLDGLKKISNGTLSNEFTDIIVSTKVPVKIPDHVPIGIKDTITVPDLGIAQEFSISLDVSNSKVETLTIDLWDPNGKQYTLFKGGVSGKTLLATYPSPSKPVSGDLTVWKGKNLKGNWVLRVIDPHFKDNTTDGAINKWSINIQTLSNKKVQAKGNLVVTGDILLKGKIIKDGKVQDTDVYPMFPKGSRPFLYGFQEDYLQGQYNYSPGNPTYPSNIGTTNAQLRQYYNDFKWGGPTGDIRQQRGGGNYGSSTTNWTWQALTAFVKNTTKSTINHKVCYYYSSRSSSSNYAGIAINGSNRWTYTSNNSSTNCTTLSFPPNQTSVVTLKTGSRYYTCSYNSCWFRNIIGFYSNSWKLPSGLEWDYKRYHDWVTGK